MNRVRNLKISSKIALTIMFGGGFFTTIAAASGIGDLCSGSISLSEGQWARFAVDAPLMRERIDSRYAIVGMEGNHYWMEYEVAAPMGNGSTIMKILIPGWPHEEGTVKRVMMQLPIIEGMDSMPPMEMPPSSIKRDDPVNPIRMACAEAENGIQESLTVTAGTFSTTRISLRSLGKDIWLSTEVPFGIVKLADAEDNGIELTAFGSDAEPGITTAPQQIPGMDP
jgi:hypothetical protein